MTSLKPAIACEKLIRLLREKGIVNDLVLDAFRKVPRHHFVDSVLHARAYEDEALPIGQGQTISQPFVVALMTQALHPRKDDKILEIGTGSGFQTAILAQFTRRLFTIERHRELGEMARKRLRDLGYEDNIVFKIGDGTKGWLQQAPFDRIIVTAGAPVVPETFTNQLAMGGRMVIPSGDRQHQVLQIFEKTPEGLTKEEIGGVVFVPLIGAHGWQENR